MDLNKPCNQTMQHAWTTMKWLVFNRNGIDFAKICYKWNYSSRSYLITIKPCQKWWYFWSLVQCYDGHKMCLSRSFRKLATIHHSTISMNCFINGWKLDARANNSLLHNNEVFFLTVPLTQCALNQINKTQSIDLNWKITLSRTTHNNQL